MVIHLRRLCAVIACLVMALASAGCLDMERSIVINKDLTGRAGLRMTIDLEAIVPLVVQMQRQMEGKTDPPTEAELTAAKAQLGLMAGMMSATPLFDSKKIAAGLPEGMTVIDSTQKMDAMKLTVNIVIGFQDITKVPLIAISAPDAAQTTVSEPLKAFQDFEIKDEGATILIATKEPVPGAASAVPQPPISPTEIMSGLTEALGVKSMTELGPMVNDMMKGLKVTTRIESPLTVVETNAATQNAPALLWSLSFEGGLEKLLATDPKSMVVSVRYKK